MLSRRASAVARLRVVRLSHSRGLCVATIDGHDVATTTTITAAAAILGTRLPGVACGRELATRALISTRISCSGDPGLFPGQRRITHMQVRGKKTRTVVKLQDLPQGLIRPLPPSEPGPGRTESGRAEDKEGDEDDGPAYPTVILQARRNMQKFDSCVLLTRVGSFYEIYFEQADEIGPLLNLKVAQKKTTAGPVPMAGFPFFQLDRILKILVQDLNRYVAIAEEFPNDASHKVKSGGLMHDRRVARIITPGTLIDENFMDPYANNYVMAVQLSEVDSCTSDKLDVEQPPDEAAEASVGVAWLDLSTGYFFTQATTLASLGSVISRVAPREIVLDKEVQSRRDHGVFSILAEDKHLITYSSQDDDLQKLSDWVPMLEAEIPEQTAASFTGEEVRAGSLLLCYVKDRLQGLCMKLQPPQRHESMQVMTIDKNSMRSLEIKQTIRDSVFKGSLLHAIRRTVTKSGARLLNEWLSAPSTSLDVINSRLNLVDEFMKDEDLRDNITTLLQRSHDSQRLVQKFALNRGDPEDLLRLASTIKATEDIVDQLQGSLAGMPEQEDRHPHCFAAMIARISLEQPLKLATRIRNAIDEESLVQQHQLEDSETGAMVALAQEIVKTEAGGSPKDAAVLPKGTATTANGSASKAKKKATSIREHYGEDNAIWVMRPGASAVLRRLHKELAELEEEKAELAETLRERLSAPSLTLKWAPALGHICHVKGRDARSPTTAAASTNGDDSTPAIRTLSSSKTTRSLHLPEWTSLGEQIDHARARIRGEEQRVFASLRNDVVKSLVKLRRNAAVLDELDIATSFARLAAEQRLTRPILTDSSQPGGARTIIFGGRHPTVEGGLSAQGRTFQRNDCALGGSGNRHGRVWLVTGPNMAGKSTFLRQVALMHVLAQAGCFVPADHAELGVVDALFTRVGSADDLYRDRSTFMVEMLETAAILRQATPRSFVIMDEIGRGTTPEEGAAVAYASLHHLVRRNGCRALFATHFHAVADLIMRDRMRLEDGGEFGQVEFYCTDVEEDDQGGFVYVHKLRKGINRQSHALKVARLAGLPEPAIQVAREVMESLEQERGPDNYGEVTKVTQGVL